MTQFSVSNSVFFMGAYASDPNVMPKHSTIMADTRDELFECGCDVHDYNLAYYHQNKGAVEVPTIKASTYKTEIEKALDEGKNVYLIEIEDDLNFGDKVYHIRQTKDKMVYLQVVELLGRRPVNNKLRQYNACALNGLEGLKQIGASDIEAYVWCRYLHEPCDDPRQTIDAEFIQAELVIVKRPELHEEDSAAWFFWCEVMKQQEIPNLLLVQDEGRSFCFLGNKDKAQQVKKDKIFFEHVSWKCCGEEVVFYYDTSAGWEKRAKNFEAYVRSLFTA